MNVRAKRNLGSRAVFLHGVENSRANSKFVLDDPKKAPPKSVPGDEVIKSFQAVEYQSDVMKMIHPQVEQALVSKSHHSQPEDTIGKAPTAVEIQATVTKKSH